MESIFTDNKNKNKKDAQDTKLNQFTQVFKESLDVLNSINEISALREKAGKIKHTYKLKKRYKSTTKLKKIKRPITLSTQNFNAKEVKSPLLKKISKKTNHEARWESKRSKLENAIEKSKRCLESKVGDWKEPNMELIYKEKLNHGNIDLYETFKNTKALPRVKKEFYLKPQLKLAGLVERQKFRNRMKKKLDPIPSVKELSSDNGFSSRRSSRSFRVKSGRKSKKNLLKPLKINTEILSSKKKFKILTESDWKKKKDKPGERITKIFQEEGISADQSRLETQTDRKDTENTEDLKRQFGERFHTNLQVDEVNKDLNSIKNNYEMSKRSEKRMLVTYKNSKSRFDLAINEHNLKIFENFIKNTTDMEKAFPIFKVKNLKNFNDFPLEDYDTELDPKIDVQYFIESRRKGKSRWFESTEKKFLWKNCEILAYDDESKKFLIQWENGAQKEVRRLNLMFEHESEEEMENRRLKSHFFRCMHLFRMSLMSFVTGKDGNENSNIFFSFSRFRNILVKINIPLTDFNQNPAWMEHLEEMFNEFGINLITFYISFKTSKNLDSFLRKFKLNDKIIKDSGDYFEECIIYGPEDQFDLDELEDDNQADIEILKVKYKDDEVNNPKSINFSIKGIFKTLAFYGVMDLEMRRNVEASRVHIVNKSMRSFESHSEANSPVEQISHFKKPFTVKILKMKKQEFYNEEKLHFSDVSSYDEDDRHYFEVKPKKEEMKASKNVENIREVLFKKSYQPFHIFLFYRSTIMEKIEDLKTVNIFQHIEDLLKGDKNADTTFPLLKFDKKKAKESIRELEKKILRVQVEVKYMCDELEPKDYNLNQKFSKRFKRLITAVNSITNEALITMMKHSCKSFLKTLRYLSLSFEFNYENNEEFDLLLSEKMFKMKHKAMIENRKIPHYMQEVIHPNHLFCRKKSDLRRRIFMMEKLILTVANKIHHQSFIKRNIKNSLGSKLPCLAFMTIKVAQNKKKSKAFKKLDFKERKALREKLRRKIYDMETSIKTDIIEIRERYLQIHLYFKPNLDIEYMMKTEYKQVNSNTLCDFCASSNVNNFLKLKPSLLECEEYLKKGIERVLMQVADINQIKLDRFKTTSSKYQFGETRPVLKHLGGMIDEFLCDMLIPMHAFMYYLNNFEYLLIDSKELIYYEVKILDEENDIGPLEKEIKLLRKDKELIKDLPDVLEFGGFKIDIKLMKKSILDGINSCIVSAFNETIGKKFSVLLESNKEKTFRLKSRLREKASSIETYIKIKNFLEGEELRVAIESISKDIQLCKAIYDFMSDCKISSEETLREYLTSLNWVRDLKLLHNSALRRMKDEMPKFIKEINSQAEKIIDDFERIEKKIKHFDNKSDILEAENYAYEARSMSEELTLVMKRAIEINAKQRTLDYEETNFNRIRNARVDFTKYVELWTFIAERWEIGMEKWLKNPFKELDENEMADTINYGSELLARLKDEFEKNEKIRAIITHKLSELKKNQGVLRLVMILKDPCFKERHWEKLFEHMKESDKNALTMQKKPDLDRITLSDLLEYHLLNHGQILKKILLKAKQEAEIEQKIMEIKDSIKNIKISPTVFDLDLDNIGLSIIPDVKKIIAVLNDHHSVCKQMLTNPEYPEEFSKKLNSLSWVVESTRAILQIIYILQNKLIKFSPIFKFQEIELYLAKEDTVKKFFQLRQDFMKVINNVSKKQMTYFIQLAGDGDNERINDLINSLKDLDEVADTIYDSLRMLFKTIRAKCPRYFFLSEEQMLICCSLLKFPQSLMAFVATMFGGVSLVKIDNQLLYRHTDCMKIVGLVNKNKEEISFEEPVEINLKAQAKIPLISIVKGIEKLKDRYFMKSRMEHIQQIVEMDFDFKKIWIYARKRKILFQILIIIINLIFDNELITLFAIAQKNKRVNVFRCLHELRDMITKNYSSFQKYPFKYLGGSFRDPEKILFFNQYILYLKYFEEKLNYLIESKVQSYLQFEFLTLPKYSIGFNKSRVRLMDLTNEMAVENFINDSLDLPSDRVKKLYQNSKILSSSSKLVKNFFGAENTKVAVNIMDMSFDYQNEFVTYNRNLAIWPICDRSMLSIFTAMNMKMNIILKGFSNQGKTETVRTMSNLLATNYIECETRVHLHPDTMINLLSGVISGGYWLLIKNLERCSFTTLSILANYANTIKESIAMENKFIKLGENDLILRDNYAIFGTFRAMSDSDEKMYNSIPLNLLDSFRTISLVKPNYTMIIEHLMTFVMSKAQSRRWANKILLYSKMYKNVENFDLVLNEKERLESARILNKSDTLGIIDLDLKLISFFIYVATLFYFGKVDDFYKKFDQDKNIYAYMKDKNIIKIEFNKVHHFTSLFKFTLNLYLKKRGTHSTRLKVFNSLFDKIFEEELSIKLREAAPKNVWRSEEVGNVVKEFMKYEPYYFHNFKNLRKEAMKYVELLTRDPNGRQYIVYGQPDSQKSKFIKLLAFIESNMKKVQINFDLFWFNLECLDYKSVFGSDDFVGLLREIFLQCHNMNNEEKATNTKKLNHLFQSTSELYSTRADFRPSQELKKTKLSDRGASWVIIDSNSSKYNRPLYELLQKVMEVVSTLNEHRVVNQFLGFSRRLRFFFEVNNLALFDPKAISENSLIYLKKPIVGADEAIELWFKKYEERYPFFKEMSSMTIIIWQEILLPYLDYIEEIKDKHYLLYYTSKISLLNNFLSFFSIFFNELRKYLVIHELFGVKKHRGYDLANSNSNYGFNDQTNELEEKFARIVSKEDGMMMISNVRSRGKKKTEKNQLKYVKTEKDKKEFIMRKLEALTIFCMTYSIYPIVLDDYKLEVREKMKMHMRTYVKKRNVPNTKFADGVLNILSNRLLGSSTNLEDYNYDLTIGEWQLWQDIKINTRKAISCDFGQTSFVKSELLRLNCMNQKSLIHPLNRETNTLDFIRIEEKILVNTKTSNMMYYFTDFFFSYNKHILLLSDHDQGKSLIVQSIIRKMIEQKKIISFNFGMQRSMSLDVVQSHIENHLLKQGGNIIAPPSDNKVVIWLEDLHLSMSDSKPESLVRNLEVQKGWFSLNRHNFTKVKDANFVMTMSFQEDNIEESKRILDSVNLDVLAKCTVMKFKKMSYTQFSTIFDEIVSESITMDSVNLSQGEKNLVNFFKKFKKIVYFNKDKLYRVSCSSLVNLNISGLMTFAKTLNMIQWGTINQEEYMTNLVWMKLLRKFFKFDFPSLHGEFKKMIKAKNELNDSLAADGEISSNKSNISADLNLNQSVGMPSLQPDKKHFQSKIGKMRKSTFISKNKKTTKRKSTMNSVDEEFNRIKEKAKQRASVIPGDKNINRMNTATPEVKKTGRLSHFGRQYSRVETRNKMFIKPGTLIINEEDEFVEPNTINIVKAQNEKKLKSSFLAPKRKKHSGNDKDKSEESIENIIAKDLERNRSPSPTPGTLLNTVTEDSSNQHGSVNTIKTKLDPLPARSIMGKGISLKKQNSLRSEIDKSLRKKLDNERLEPLTLAAANKLIEIKELEDQAEKSDDEDDNDDSLEEYELQTKKADDDTKVSVNNVRRISSGRKLSLSRKSSFNEEKKRGSIIDELKEEMKEVNHTEIERSKTPAPVTLHQKDFQRNKTELHINIPLGRVDLDKEKKLQDKIEKQLDNYSPSIPQTRTTQIIKPIPSKKADRKPTTTTVPLIPEVDSENESFNSSSDSSDINTIAEIDMKSDFKLKKVETLKEFSNEIISMTMSGIVTDKNFNILKDSCIFNKFFMFDLSLSDLERRDMYSKINNEEDSLFNVIDAQNEKKLMGFLRSKLTNFVYNYPEALYSLKLNGCNFSHLLNDFTTLHLNLKSKNQHVMINSFKSLLYSRYLTFFVCKSLFCKFYYIDLMNHDSTEITEDYIRKYNSYQKLIQIIFENFADIWSDNRLVFMIHVPNRALTSSIGLLNEMLGLIDSIIFNTDLMIYHFGEKIKKMLSIIKSDALYNHFPENHLIYMFRNKIQSRVNFVLITELSKHEVRDVDVSQTSLKDNKEEQIMKKYLFENYPKLYSKLKKVCMNGMLTGGDEDIPEFYEKVTPLSDLSPSVIFIKGYRIQLNFLKVLDRDYEFMNMVRPMDENLLLYEQVIKALYNRFEEVKSEVETQGMMREQILILQKIKRRNEILKIEFDQFQNMVASKEKEKKTIEKTNLDLIEQRDKLSSQRNKLLEAISNLEKRIQGYKKEESIYVELEQKLSEVTKSIVTMSDRDFIKSVKLSNFFNSKIFAIYSVLFHEIFRIEIQDKLTYEELSVLDESNISLKRCENYILGFSRILEDFELLKSFLNYSGKKQIEEKTILTLGDIIQKSYDDSFVHMNKTQKNIMKWIDLLIEWTRFGLNKDQRDKHLAEIETKISTVSKEIETRSTLLAKIKRSLEEQPGLIKTVQDKINFFKEKKIKSDRGMKKTKDLFELLQKVNEKYTQLSSVFRSKDMQKDTMIELMASFIVFWSQYPFVIKKSLFFTHIKSLKQEPSVFNKNPIFEILGSEQLLLDALKSKVPFNVNFLNNVAICEFIHDSYLPFPLIYDPSGSYLKWIHKKYPRGIATDFYTPSPGTIKNIQDCLKDGKPYLLVDPGYELLKQVHSIIDWKFKQFCQNIIREFEEEKEAIQEVEEEESPENSRRGGGGGSKSRFSSSTRTRAFNHEHVFVSNELKYNGKKIFVKDGFKLYIILEKNTIESLDESLMAKVLIINNSLDEKKIWMESVKDELALHFHGDTRAVVVDDYLSMGMMAKIHQKYRKLNQKLKSYDFLTDNLESDNFRKIVKLTEEVDKLTEIFELENKKLNEKLSSSKSNKDFNNSIHSTIQPIFDKIYIDPLSIQNFLSYSYYYKVPGMKRLTDTYELLTSRLFTYQKVIKSLETFVGPEYFGTLDIFVHRIMQVVDIFKSKIKIDWMKREDNMKKIIEDEGDEEKMKELEITLKLKKKKRREETEKIVAKMEKHIYYQLVNSVPKEKRFIVSFLLGIMYHTDTIQVSDSQSFKNFIDQLRIFLYSEKLMPKEQRRILFTNDTLYVKYNQLFNKIKIYFSNTSSNLPELYGLEHDFDSRFLELKELRSRLKKTKHSQLSNIFDGQNSIDQRRRFNSESILEGGQKSPDRPASPVKNDEPKKFKKIGENSVQTKIYSSKSIAKKKHRKRISFVPNIENTTRLKINAIRIQAQLETNTLDKKGVRENKLDSNRYLFRQMSYIAKEDKSNKRMDENELKKNIEENTLNFDFDETGEVIVLKKVMPAIAESSSDSDSNSSNISGRSPSIEKSKIEKIRGGDSKGLSSPSGSLNLASGKNIESREKSFKKIVRSILESNKKKKTMVKIAKSKKALFTHNFRTYISKVMEIMLDRRDVNQGLNISWRNYCHNSLFTLIGATQESLMPITPVSTHTVDKWNLVTLLTFFKISRPDLMNYAVSVLYPEIKSPKYYEVPSALSTAIHTNWFGKPTMLLYGRMNINPADKIKEYAASERIKFILLDLEMIEVANLVEIITDAANNGKWILMENIQLIPRSKSIRIMKSFLDVLDKQMTHYRYKAWILYHVKRNPYQRNLSSGEDYGLPEWFSWCYKIFLNSSNNVFGEMVGLYSKEVKENQIAFSGDLETNQLLIKKNRKRRSRKKEESSVDTKLSQANKNKLNEESSNPTLRDYEDYEESNIFNEKINFNFHEEILIKKQLAGNFNSKIFLQEHKKEILFKLRFIISLIRQRNPQIDILQDKKFKYIEVHLSDKVINLILEKVISIVNLNIEEQFSIIFKYLAKLFFPIELVNCFQDSPLLFENLFEIFVFSSTSKNVMLSYGRQRYLLPGSDLSNKTFSEVFEHCLLTYPYLDNIKLMGLKNNEEKLINYKISRKTFKLLSNLFKDTGIADEKTNYLDHHTLNLFVELNQGSDDQIIDASVVDSLEYGVEIMTAFEKHSQKKNSASQLLKEIIEGFDDEAFALIEETLLGKRISSPASGSPMNKRRRNMKTGGISPIKLNRSKEEDQGSKKRKSDFNRTHTFKTFAFQQNVVQNSDLLEYKKYFLLHEFRTLKRIIHIVLSDLRMAKYYLDGEVNHRSKERALKILNCFNKNEIPSSWIDKLSSFNLCLRDFSMLIRSLMMKYDNLFYLSISLNGIMPPILDISRLLDPSSFLSNAALFNNLKFDKSMMNTCLMVRSCEKGSSRMYEDSYIFKIRGVRVKGGRINTLSGMLEVEKSREFVHDLGSLQLEFTQFEDKDEMRFMEGEPSIPIIYNTKFYEQENNELVFENSMKEKLTAKTFQKSKRKNNSKKSKNLANRFSLMQDGLMNYVRIPVAFSSQKNRKSFLNLNFYFYCYSLKPQIYWLKKGTHIVIEDSFK